MNNKHFALHLRRNGIGLYQNENLLHTRSGKDTRHRNDDLESLHRGGEGPRPTSPESWWASLPAMDARRHRPSPRDASENKERSEASEKEEREVKLLRSENGGMEQVTRKRIRFTKVSSDVAVQVGTDGSVSGEIVFLELDKKRRYIGLVRIPFIGVLQQRGA